MAYYTISDRYGADRAQVTLEDYEQLNPKGKFEIKHVNGKNHLIEQMSDAPGDFVVLAEEE